MDWSIGAMRGMAGEERRGMSPRGLERKGQAGTDWMTKDGKGQDRQARRVGVRMCGEERRKAGKTIFRF
ncbi:MAG: hypothetical protein V1793_25015 [Pseudomonadota bacterium]